MKRILFVSILAIQLSHLPSQLLAQSNLSWVSTTENSVWYKQKAIPISSSTNKADLCISTDSVLQKIEGFGTCFNEQGWTSLNLLKPETKENILRELFASGVGANFTICRMPIAANDFAEGWYSYNETAGDFDMTHFSIDHDKATLIPFIRNAQKYNPTLKVWASPWSPPSWMKYNNHYAARSLQKGITNIQSEEWGIDFRGLENGLDPKAQGTEGTDMFIQEVKYYKAYALYFSKFIRAYNDQKIKIGMVMPQNEFNSAQPFASCTWTAKGLSKFISYLGPQMKLANVDLFFGTMERANPKLVDTILNAPESKKWVKGVGFQWAGKDAIPTIHQNYPNLTLYQSEQECGNGTNSWKFAKYSWGLMKHYFNNGVTAYMYWNTSLKKGSISKWGWKQNSLISVDTTNNTFQYNFDYYALKHLSHFVKPGARMLKLGGAYQNALAFINPDKSIAIIIQNDATEDKKVKIKINNKEIEPTLKADSFNSFLLK